MRGFLFRQLVRSNSSFSCFSTSRAIMSPPAVSKWTPSPARTFTVSPFAFSRYSAKPPVSPANIVYVSMKIAFPGRVFASFWTIALILSNSCVCVSLRVTGRPIQTTTPPARLTVSITAPTRRRYSAFQVGLAKAPIDVPSGARHVAVVVVGAEVEDDDLRLQLLDLRRDLL